MIAKIGDVLECDFGSGVLVACTKKWAIIRSSSWDEYGIYLPDNWIAFPAETDGDDSEQKEIEIQE